MKIGVFDSGIGGLTVLNKLIEKYPNNEYTYYGDIKNIPYGDKSIEELKELSSKIIDFLIEKKVDLIVIACGTISSNLSNYLKQKYSIKIIDIISPVINYLNNCDYEKIGVIATQATVNSNIFNNINKDIKQVACPKLVPLIENKKQEELKYIFDEYLLDLNDRDLIVLGCTHYPIIKDYINKYFNNKIELLDMSECINNIENNDIKKIDLYFSKLDDNIINNIRSIIKEDINSINLIK